MLQLRLVEGDWLGVRPVIVDGVRWDGTNVFNGHHDIIHGSHRRKDRTEEKPGSDGGADRI